MPEDLSIVSGGFDDNAIIAYLTNNCENLLTENDRRTAKNAGVENHFSNDWINEIYHRTKLLIAEDGINKKYDFSSNGTGNKMMTLCEAGKVYLENIKKYGYKSWYEWCIRHWGCKWNACESTIKRNNNTTIIVTFQTAWSTCMPIFEALSKIFPNISIDVKYADEDLGSNTGEIKLKAGNSEVKEFDFGKESQEFAAEVLGYDLSQYTYSEEYGYYVYNE